MDVSNKFQVNTLIGMSVIMQKPKRRGKIYIQGDGRMNGKGYSKAR